MGRTLQPSLQLHERRTWLRLHLRLPAAAAAPAATFDNADQPALSAPALHPVTAPLPTSTQPASSPAAQLENRWSLRPLVVVGGLLATLIIGIIIGVAIGSTSKDSQLTISSKQTSTTTAKATTTTAPPTTTAAPTTAAPTTEAPTTTTAPPAPAETPGQQNARQSAQEYLATQAFSRAGLIKQLSSQYGSGYSVADATYGVDSLNVDWNEQAAKAAKEYLATQAFSRAGLIQQLESQYGSEFTHAQAVYGVTAAGL